MMKRILYLMIPLSALLAALVLLLTALPLFHAPTLAAFTDGDVLLLDIDTRVQHRVDVPRFAYALWWASETRRVVTDQADHLNDIYMMDLPRGNARYVTDTPDVEERLLNITPDGEHIAYLTREGDVNHLWVAGPGAQPLLVQSSLQPISGARLSPDGAHITYAAYNADVSRTLYTVNIESGNRVELARGINIDYRWSPDAQRLAVHYEVGEQFHVAMAAAGVAPEVVGTFAHHEVGAWTPDGTRYTFPARVGDAWHLYDYTDVLRRGLALAGTTRSLTWSRDGAQLALVSLSPESRTFALYVLDADGLRQLKPSANRVRYLTFSGDGRYLAYADNDPRQRGSLTLVVETATGHTARVLAGNATPLGWWVR